MEASALRQLRVGSGGGRPRTPLLRMQSDERLVGLVRRGNHAAFGVLVGRYESRLLAFCRHLLRSREDAEDVLQEVFTSAFKAMLADERPIIVRPWLYRIARNRCLNHLRRISAIGVDSIEDHFSEHVPSTSEAAQQREDLWLLVGDIRELPESQRSALLLREMEALSYEQIADVMEKTVPSVKSLLIRARRGLAEAAEARSLDCDEAMVEVGECHLGVRERPSRVVRRHLGECARCAALGSAEESLAGLRLALPLAPLLLLRRLLGSQLVHSARAGSTAAGAGAATAPAAGGSGAAAGLLTAGIGGLAGKTAVGLTAAALGVAGAVVVDDNGPARRHPAPARPAVAASAAGVAADGPSGGAPVYAPTSSAAAHGSPPARQAVATTATTLAAQTTTTRTAPGTAGASTTATTAGVPATTTPTGGVAPSAQLAPGGTGAAPGTTTTVPGATTPIPGATTTVPGATTPTPAATTPAPGATAPAPTTAVTTTGTSSAPSGTAPAAASPTG